MLSLRLVFPDHIIMHAFDSHRHANCFAANCSGLYFQTLSSQIPYDSEQSSSGRNLSSAVCFDLDRQVSDDPPRVPDSYRERDSAAPRGVHLLSLRELRDALQPEAAEPHLLRGRGHVCADAALPAGA